MDWFSRENLYNLPRVTVFSFGSEIYRQENKIYVLPVIFYRIIIWCTERELWIFSQNHLFEMKFGSLTKPYLPQTISLKILRTKLWNFATMFLKILASHSKNFIFWTFVEKKIIKKMPRWPVWSSETLESQSSDTKCCETSSKNRWKEISTP